MRKSIIKFGKDGRFPQFDFQKGIGQDGTPEYHLYWGPKRFAHISEHYGGRIAVLFLFPPWKKRSVRLHIRLRKPRRWATKMHWWHGCPIIGISTHWGKWSM